MTKKSKPEAEAKTLVQIATEAGVKPREVWLVMAGAITDNSDLAMVLYEQIGIQPRTLMFETARRIRPGVIDWFTRAIETYQTGGKNKYTTGHIWRILNNAGVAGINLAWGMEHVTGIPALSWVSPDAKNWILKP